MKIIIPIYPKLAGKMAESGHDTSFLAKFLGVSADTVRRSLNGARQFELPEIHNLMKLYNCSFEELFPATTNKREKSSA